MPFRVSSYFGRNSSWSLLLPCHLRFAEESPSCDWKWQVTVACVFSVYYTGFLPHICVLIASWGGAAVAVCRPLLYWTKYERATTCLSFPIHEQTWLTRIYVKWVPVLHTPKIGPFLDRIQWFSQKQMNFMECWFCKGQGHAEHGFCLPQKRESHTGCHNS